MTDPKPPTKKSTSRVDWSDPRLEALLKKTESWQLDNRGSFQPQDIGVQIGWSGDAGVGAVDSSRPGVLVWEHQQVMVIETNFPIEQGELVRIDRLVGDGVQIVWGSLIESRPGLRTEDGESGIHVHWVNMR
ncbi:hypothetical protein [Rhodanobacter sp. BL-MT-08]